MNLNLLAKDIMNTNPVVLPANVTIVSAVDVLTKHNISGAPVVCEQGKLVGFVSLHDIMVELWCDDYNPDQNLTVSNLMKTDVVSLNTTERLANIVERLCIDKAQLFPTSTSGIATINYASTETVEQRAKHMEVHNHTTLPVIENGYVLGVISRFEVINALREVYAEIEAKTVQLA